MIASDLLGARVGPATVTAAVLQEQLGLRPEVVEQPLRAGQAVSADRGLLVVLEAVNAGGKDGTIAEMATILGTTRLRVERFSKPQSRKVLEDSWERALAVGPSHGELVFFNRSYYGGFLRAVMDGDSDAHLAQEAIRDLEAAITASGTILLKLFLHIDREEQFRRLELRRHRPELQGLHNPEDYRDQDHWEELMEAYQAVINATNERECPWFVIPANDRVIRNVLVGALIHPHLSIPDPKTLDSVT